MIQQLATVLLVSTLSLLDVITAAYQAVKQKSQFIRGRKLGHVNWDVGLDLSTTLV